MLKLSKNLQNLESSFIKFCACNVNLVLVSEPLDIVAHHVFLKHTLVAKVKFEDRNGSFFLN